MGNQVKKQSKRKSIENGRAEKAYEFVHNVKNENFKTDYKAYVKRLAPLIKTNGLGNTIAFIYSKKEGTSNRSKAYNKIYQQLEEGLYEEKLIQKRDLVNQVVSVDSERYRHLTRETLALLNWWKRFVDGMIKEKEK